MDEVRLSNGNMKNFQMPLELTLITVAHDFGMSERSRQVCVWSLGWQNLSLTLVQDSNTVPTETMNSPEWSFQQSDFTLRQQLVGRVSWISYHIRPQIPFYILLCKLSSWPWLWREKSSCSPLGINYNSPHSGGRSLSVRNGQHSWS